MAGLGGRCVIVDLRRPVQIANLSEVDGSHRLDVSSDGTLLAAGNREGKISVLNINSKEKLAMLSLPKCCTCVAFSNGPLLATSSFDGGARIWDWKKGIMLHEFRGRSYDETYDGKVAFSPDGKRLVTGASEGLIRLFDTDTGAEQWHKKAHSEFVSALAYSPDGRIIASASGYSENRIKLLGRCHGQLARQFDGTHRVGQRISIFPRWPAARVVQHDQTVRVWDTAGFWQISILRGHLTEVHCVAYSSDGRTIASGDKDGTINVWDAGTHYRDPPLVLPGVTASLQFSRDGNKVFLINGGTVQVRDHNFLDDFNEFMQYHELGRLNRTLAISPDDHLLAVADLLQQIKVANAETGKIVANFVGRAGLIAELGLCEDGQTLVTVGTEEESFNTRRQIGSPRFPGHCPKGSISNDCNCSPRRILSLLNATAKFNSGT